MSLEAGPKRMITFGQNRRMQPASGGRRSGKSLLVRTALAAALVSALAPGCEAAEEPSGCNAFKWPLATEAALLQAGNKPNLPPDGADAMVGKAFTLQLISLPNAHLPTQPERAPKTEPSMAGFARFAAPSSAGPYEMTISQGAWIDVVQDGHALKPSAFSGARDCPSVRKSIRFSLATKPFVIQISGTKSDTIDVIVEPQPQ